MGVMLVKSGDEQPTPALTDIPGKLRQLADLYESGEEVLPAVFAWVVQHDDGSIGAGNFGGALSKLEFVGLMALASRLLTLGPTRAVRG